MQNPDTLEALGLELTGALQERNKFVTCPVLYQGEPAFLKTVRDSSSVSQHEDLQNEAQWNEFVRPHLARDGTKVPEIIATDPDFAWVLFEDLQAPHLEEEQLPIFLGRLINLGASIQLVPLPREPGDINTWYLDRLARFRETLEHPLFNAEDKERFEATVAADKDTGVLTAGVIHGDLNLKNVLAHDKTFGIVDAEFGTSVEKPEWDKPRMHDVAYLYHLLLCQYQDPGRADLFKTLISLRDQDIFDINQERFEQEFQLSVLERTLSMMSHFVTRLTPEKKIDDMRRTDPKPYAKLISQALETIQ